MSLEQEISKLNANFERFFAAGGTAGAPAGGKGGTGKGATTPTVDEVRAVALKVQEEKGKDAAVALIKKHGAPNIASMKPAKYAAFIAACEVLLNAEDGEDGDGDGDDTL